MAPDKVKEYLEIQQEAFKSSVSLLFDSCNKRINDLTDTVYEIKSQLETSQNEVKQLKLELSKCKDELQTKYTVIDSLQNNITHLENKISSIENHTRKKNIRIDGISENNQENWEQTQIKVQKLIDETLQLNDVKVDFAHRISSKDDIKPIKTIIARMSHDMDKDKILKNTWRLKGSNIYISEDLSELTLEKRKSKLPEMKKAKEEGKIAYFKKDKLIIKNRRPDSNKHNQTSTRQLGQNFPPTTPPSNVSQLVDKFTPQAPHEPTQPGTNNDTVPRLDNLALPQRLKSPISSKTRSKLSN